MKMQKGQVCTQPPDTASGLYVGIKLVEINERMKTERLHKMDA